MKLKIELGREGIVVLIPYEALTKILKPRVEFTIPFGFTNRENQVFGFIHKGMANKEIAGELNLSERTVKYYVSKLLQKTKTKRRVELQTMYLQAGSNGNGRRQGQVV